MDYNNMTVEELKKFREKLKNKRSVDLVLLERDMRDSGSLYTDAYKEVKKELEEREQRRK
jgi:hypothetical protein